MRNTLFPSTFVVVSHTFATLPVYSQHTCYHTGRDASTKTRTAYATQFSILHLLPPYIEPFRTYVFHDFHFTTPNTLSSSRTFFRHRHLCHSTRHCNHLGCRSAALGLQNAQSHETTLLQSILQYFSVRFCIQILFITFQSCIKLGLR